MYCYILCLAFCCFSELGARSSSNVGRNLAPPNQEVSGKARINPPLTDWSLERPARACIQLKAWPAAFSVRSLRGGSKDRIPTTHRHRVRGSRGTELRLRIAASKSPLNGCESPSAPFQVSTGAPAYMRLFRLARGETVLVAPPGEAREPPDGTGRHRSTLPGRFFAPSRNGPKGHTFAWKTC